MQATKDSVKMLLNQKKKSQVFDNTKSYWLKY